MRVCHMPVGGLLLRWDPAGLGFIWGCGPGVADLRQLHAPYVGGIRSNFAIFVFSCWFLGFNGILSLVPSFLQRSLMCALAAYI